MAATSNKLSDRNIFYYRRRFLNRVHEALTSFFDEETERRGLTKQDIAERIGRDPAQITRWLSAPSNLTLESVSDLLQGVGAEMDVVVARLSDRPQSNYMHPLIEAITAPAPVATITPTRAGYTPLTTTSTNKQRIEA
jgi:hypothetical protein